MKKETKKKAAASVVAAGLILALGLGGTLAKYVDDDNNDHIEGNVAVNMVLHDDYDAFHLTNANPMPQKYDRKIYVENNGDVNLYIRVKLSECLEYDGDKIMGDPSIKATWEAHMPVGNAEDDCGAEVHRYFTWTMGGATTFKSGLKNRFDVNTGAEDTSGTLNTQNAQVITMKEYAAMSVADKDAGPYWVVDNEDGYAYWSQMLPGKNGGDPKATGLLLSEIKNEGVIDASFFYGIYAKAEAVTESDVVSWINGGKPAGAPAPLARASEDAGALLKRLSPKWVEIAKLTAAQQIIANRNDYDGDGFLCTFNNASGRNEYKSYMTELNAATPAP